MSKQLAHHLRLMVTVSDDADQQYQASLAHLRQHAAQAVPVLYHSYQRTEDTRYFRRWQLVQTLRELRYPATVGPLAAIARSQIPPERWSDPERSSRSKESHIRVTAVDGLGELARDGSTAAEAVLFELITHPDLSVRRRAVRGYLAADADYEGRATLLKSRLPAHDHPLISLEVTPITQVPHPQIPVDLRPRPRRSNTPAPTVR